MSAENNNEDADKQYENIMFKIVYPGNVPVYYDSYGYAAECRDIYDYLYKNGAFLDIVEVPKEEAENYLKNKY